MKNFRLYQNALETISACVYCKDKKGIYGDVNNAFVTTGGMQSSHDALGQKDSDLAWHEQSSIMMQNDQEIIQTGLTKTYIESGRSPHLGMLTFLSHKSPIISQKGKIIGVFGLSFLIKNTNSMATALHEVYRFIDNPKARSQCMEYEFMLKASEYGLTKRQAHCIYYLTRGMTIKQIAMTLSLSSRTVEHYMDAIKTKWNCHSRYELVEKAMTIASSFNKQ